MRFSLKNLPPRVWVWIALPAAVIAYPIAAAVVPALVHAVVPEAVRSVLSLI